MSRRFLPVLLAALVGCTPAPSTAPPAKVTQQVQPAAQPIAVTPPPAARPVQQAPVVPAPTLPAAVDPVALFKPILAKLQSERTPVSVFSRDHGVWRKRQMAAASVKYDIRKTESLVSPFEATASFAVSSYIGPECPTQQAAAISVLPAQPLPAGKAENWAKFLFQDGGWVVADCGWDSPLTGFHASHSSNRLGDPSVDEWWAFFGGR